MFGSKRVDDEMELKRERTVRFYPDEKQNPAKPTYQIAKPGGLVASRIGSGSSGKSKVFAEDHEPWRKRILDPGSDLVLKWNRVFLVSCLVALFIDPLYFYLPSVRKGDKTSYLAYPSDNIYNTEILEIKHINNSIIFVKINFEREVGIYLW